MYLWLTAAMLIAAVPGWIMAPLGINAFDEPYQILNSFDPLNAVYSPLSARLARPYALLNDWSFLSFRYLLVVFQFVTIFIAGAYALARSRRPAGVVMVSSAAMLFCSVFKSVQNLYGWDTWTQLALILIIILFLSFFSRPSVAKVLALGILSGIAIPLRLPNVVLFAVVPLLFFCCARLTGGWRRALRDSLLFVTVAAVVTLFIFILLYGSPGAYLERMRSLPIGVHRPLGLMGTLVQSLLRHGVFFCWVALGYWFAELICRRVSRPGVRLLASVALCCYFAILMLLSRNVYSPAETGNMGVAVAWTGICLMTVRAIHSRNLRLLLAAVALFVLGSVPAFGSNCGYVKFLSWPLYPLIFLFLERNITPALRRFAVCVAVTLLALAFLYFNRPAYLDAELKNLDYRVELKPFEGMYTGKRQHELLTEAWRDAKPYIDAGYELITVRGGNGYMWELLFMNTNELARHTFDDWYAFDNPDYVEGLMRKALKARAEGKKVLFMYMAWPNEEQPTLLWKSLSRDMVRVVEGRGYSYFTFPESSTIR